jgi:glycerol-3-phosphate dehydrogenase (NAD(P)+)
MKLLVLGAGAWGTALAVHASTLAAPRQVTLWARDPEQYQALLRTRRNESYLPDVAFPQALHLLAPDVLSSAVADADLVVLGTPSTALAEWLSKLQAMQCAAPVVWLSKGFVRHPEGNASLLAHELAAQLAPSLRCGVFSGPSFAQEVASGKPTAMVAASKDPQVSQLLIDAFHGGSLRVYANDDVVGVEVGGAVKNVLAIATGLCDGLGFGLNARAALITRGLAEMTRLGAALGAKQETFMGLSGLGDLVLTATGDLSRNRQVGLLLAQGKSLDEALKSLGHVAEGVNSAHIVLARAQSLGVEMPITQAVVAVLGGALSTQQAVAVLMGRSAKREV